MSGDIIQTFGGVRGYEENDVVYLHIEEVARGLGFTQTKGDTEYVRWETVNKYLSDLSFPTSWENQNTHDYYIPENIFYRLCMKARNEFAETFQAKVADEIIPSIRRHGMYATKDFIQRSISDPDWAIAVLQKLKFETEQRELAERQRDEAIRTKYHFVEGRDAEMCGRVGGLTKANTDLRQKNTQLTNANTELTTENDKLKNEAGIGKDYKQVRAIKFVNQYFCNINRNFWIQLGKELSDMSKSMDISILPCQSSKYGTINCYHIAVINEFKRQLDNGVIFSRLKNYHKNIGMMPLFK